MLPDRRILFIKRKGDVHLYDPAKGSSEVIHRMEVFSDLEDGLLGLALDPDFDNLRDDRRFRKLVRQLNPATR